MRIVIVLNDKAGTLARMRDPEAAIAAIRGAFAAEDHEVVLRRAHGRTMGRAIAAALDETPDAVVVGGGDGSLFHAVNTLGGRDIALGILPLGTMNLTARDLGLSADPVEAARQLARGGIERVDMVAMGEILFLNAAVLGLYPWMVLDRERARRRLGLAKWPAMVRAFWRALWRRHDVEVTLTPAGAAGPLAYRTPLLVVANNRFQLRSGPVPTRARLDDGELAVYVARSRGTAGLLRLAAHIAAGQWQLAADIDLIVTGGLQVTTRHHRLRLALDGEIAHVVPPLDFRLKPRSLRMLAPGRAES